MTYQPMLGDDKVPTFNEMYEQFGDLGNLKDFFYNWGGLNKWLFQAINNLRGDTYDSIMLLINKLGEHKYFPHFMIGLTVYVTLSILIRKLRGKGSIRPRLVMWFGVYMVLVVGFVVNGLVVNVVKDYFAYPRPYVELAKENVHLLEVRDGADEGHRSFPSGHVAYVTFLIVALWPVFVEGWRWHSLLLIACVGWARISLGVHYPADVVGAFLIATINIVAVRAVVYTALRKLFNIVC